MPDKSGGFTVLVDNRSVTDIIYLDLCKAYDTVLRDILVSKLERDKFEGWNTWCVRNCLYGHILRAVGNGSMSKCRPVMSGISQELVLGLTLFNNFVMSGTVGWSAPSAILPTTPSCAVQLTRWREGQRDLDRLQRQACLNLMKLNKAKCEVLHLGSGNPKHKHSLGGERIESSSGQKDLGMISS
ncbi:rna-directed dna polymerase from mobile element jockey-like [Willisornis vidua]|uniref:Rna-directed dna polymerase from mobile element jockey-like n=1 Tax=Willisornis vidua TaxID=1566151 RepID=A0ABQ9CWH1_9PASS|nr:rna-directed dna polymerase from mobile element jockey-like [Willisornis vidua]